MSKNKFFFGVACLGILLLILSPKVRATSVDDILAKIVLLQAQIKELQQQLTGVSEIAWCHNFNTKLGFTNQGEEVKHLQRALQKSSFYNGSIDGVYGNLLASAVTGFQQKYHSEVLAPWGLKYGTGYAGNTTLAKLSSLYGCSVVPPQIGSYIKVISPNGGEELISGQSHNITWNSKGVEKVNAFLCCDQIITGGGCVSLFSNINASLNSYIWNLESDSYCVPGSNVKVWLKSAEDNSLEDESDSSFSIEFSLGGDCHSTPTWSWDYCSVGCKCDVGQGDCDSDAECSTGHCALDVGTKYGKTDTLDVCETTTIVNSCFDSDGGDNNYVKGTTKGNYYPSIQNNSVEKIFYDSCEGDNIVEYYCIDSSTGNIASSGNELISVKRECFGGCSNGACNKGISITSPTVGTKWLMGETYNIKWTSDNLEKVNIVLLDYRAGRSYYTVATNVSAFLGSYAWTVPTSLQGSNYAFGIWIGEYSPPAQSGDWEPLAVTAEKSIYDVSDNYFSIPKYVKVISPNGGEIYNREGEYSIEWSAPEATRVVVDVLDQSTLKSVTSQIPAVLSNIDSYQWTIPSTMSVGSYKVKISICPPLLSEIDCANTDLDYYGYDTSDASFNIIE